MESTGTALFKALNLLVSNIDRYSLSKLLQILAIQRFIQLAPVEETGVIVNFVNPGLCSTGLVRYHTLSTKLLTMVLRGVVGRSAEWGSRSLLFGMAAGKKSHGKHWVPEWISNSEGEEWAATIWDEVALQLERTQPGCVNKVLKV
ncbi:hypothetical protein ACHAPJ_013158 [Fusarium lateritium]